MKMTKYTRQTALAACRAMLGGTTPPERLIGPPTPCGLVRYAQDGTRHVAPGYVPPIVKRRKKSYSYVVMVLNS